MQHSIDRIFLILTYALVVIGFCIFSSASLGLLAREGARFSSVAISQILFGIVGGSIALFITSMVHYRWWRQYAFYFFAFSLILTSLVFIDKIGLEHGGAVRWLRIGSFSFQPSELLKLGFIIYIATWLSGMRSQVKSFVNGTLPFIGLIVLAGVPLLKQPDTDTFLIMVASALAMFITAGGRFRDVIGMVVGGVFLVLILAHFRPYVQERIDVFLHPEVDQRGSGWQINQSLIAIGSGGIVGRGFGQSIQKFEYLPEPISDSIFAVYAEEFGFVGSLVLVFLFTGFALRGYRIATHSSDFFGMLLVVGIITLILAQVFLNIAAMVALAPLSGLPLPFISHGGTALFVLLAAVGIVLSVSKNQRSTTH